MVPVKSTSCNTPLLVPSHSSLFLLTATSSGECLPARLWCRTWTSLELEEDSCRRFHWYSHPDIADF